MRLLPKCTSKRKKNVALKKQRNPNPIATIELVVINHSAKKIEVNGQDETNNYEGLFRLRIRAGKTQIRCYNERGDIIASLNEKITQSSKVLFNGNKYIIVDL